MIKKITHGWVEQEFDDDGNLIDQRFKAGDLLVEYENENGDAITVTDVDEKPAPYAPFEMVQPTEGLRFTADEDEDSKENLLAVPCHFTSVWDDGQEITTACLYVPETREISDIQTAKGDPPEGCLEREYITLPDGDELKVCPVCSDYTMRPIIDGEKDLYENEECPNPDCPSMEN